MARSTTPHSQAGWSWVQLRNKRIAMARSRAEPCCLCGQPIDYTLKGIDPWGPTAEHHNAVKTNGKVVVPLEELGVAHLTCNSRSGGALRGTATSSTRGPSQQELERSRPT